jgi:hypothetical protein
MWNRKVRRLWLLALLPTHVLLAANQGDQQSQQGKQALLDMQWRETQLGGTLATHPEVPPIRAVIFGGRWFIKCPDYLGHCSLHASFNKE